jgi:hypothetical protein
MRPSVVRALLPTMAAVSVAATILLWAMSWRAGLVATGALAAVWVFVVFGLLGPRPGNP